MTAGVAGARAQLAASQDQQHATSDALRGGLAAAAWVGDMVAETRDLPSGAELAMAAGDLSFIQDCNW